MPSFAFPPHAVVATTGALDTVALDVRAWIHARGGTYTVWGPHITHLLVGSTEGRKTWKLTEAEAMGLQILYANNLPKTEVDLWVDRYRPQVLQDVIGHAAEIKTLQGWLSEWSKKGSKPAAAALLTGPPGIGKTTVAHAVARAAGYDVVEFNASDERSATAVRAIFDRCAKSQTFAADVSADATRRLILMDEVDGMSSGDRGGLAEIAKICRSGVCTFPILCIANDRQSPKIRPLVAVALDVRFSRPTKTTIAKSLLHSVVSKEGLAVKAADLERLCEENGNDIRSIVNTLQFSESRLLGAGTKDGVLRMDPFSATGRVFGTTATHAEREAAVFVDTSLVPLMVAEGYLGAADKSRNATTGDDRILAAAKAAEALSMWDMLDTRIHRQQAWGLLPAAVNAVITAAQAADGPAPFQIFPSWLGKQSKRTKHRRLLSDVEAHLRTHGDPYVSDTRSFLRTDLFRGDRTPADVVGRLLELGMTREDMLETLVDTCFKGEESAVAMETKKKSAITREWKKRVGNTEGGLIRSGKTRTEEEGEAEVVGDEDEVDLDED